MATEIELQPGDISASAVALIREPLRAEIADLREEVTALTGGIIALRAERDLANAERDALTEALAASEARVAALARLAEQWRGSAACCINRAEADRPWGDEDRSRAAVYTRCADELDAAALAGATERTVDAL